MGRGVPTAGSVPRLRMVLLYDDLILYLSEEQVLTFPQKISLHLVLRWVMSLHCSDLVETDLLFLLMKLDAVHHQKMEHAWQRQF